MVRVVFETAGPLGISWRHRREDGSAIVKTIKEGEFPNAHLGVAPP